MKTKKSRYQFLTSGTVTLEKHKIQKLINAALDSIEEDRLVRLTFDITYDRYYSALKNLKKRTKKKQNSLQ